jgi:hypothetical protein
MWAHSTTQRSIRPHSDPTSQPDFFQAPALNVVASVLGFFDDEIEFVARPRFQVEQLVRRILTAKQADTS